jgi:phosphate transport system permease protein
MSLTLVFAFILILSAAGFVLGKRKALAAVGGNSKHLHSLPNYYGWNVAIYAFVPALLCVVAWLMIQPIVVERQLSGLLAGNEATTATPELQTDLTLRLADVRRLASGLDTAVASGTLTSDEVAKLRTEFGNVRDKLASAGVALGSEVSPTVLAAAQSYREMTATGALGRAVLAIIVSIIGFIYALRMTGKDFRARNNVERVVLALLILASTIAILTTVGIVLSMFSESLRFFSMYPASEFFFGLTWAPNFAGDSDFGLAPLLWGTLYISLVSMLVAVPIGLFAAIYLAEYASPRVRSVVKPLIEIIAGIPTVVFGLFALVTVGPFLRDWFAEPFGFGNSGSSVMTAGIVIGILNIPFISSLADDIINAVPQSMRDGSLGIGATKSETIKQVVLPAALPGIVGAILLAASRAIGETMIVTMGAGAAAKLDLNPFEAMTTITVKIVSQLTGDTEFNSPETLVAFALGMTLFVITLGLNIFALYIVRRYKEQYE